MIELIRIIDFLNELLEIENYKEDGLQIDINQQIYKIGFAVNLSFNVIEKARDEKIDLLITHHNAWKSTDAENSDKKYSLLKDYNISYFFAHDSLDHHKQLNPSKSILEKLELKEIGQFYENLGLITESKCKSFEQFIDFLYHSFDTKIEKFENNSVFNKIGIIPGWGARPEWISLAKKAGVDTFISGEAIHFDKLYAKESNINLILIGHYNSEKYMMENFLEKLKKDLKVKMIFINDDVSEKLF